MAPYLPHQCRCYAEPFCGSAALYWYLFGQAQQGEFQFQQVRLSDRNPELMNCYQIVRDRVEDLIQELTAYRQQHSEAFYYHIRSLDQQQLDPLTRAARFIYLNKTCFNGLYRVNRAGQFNVPMGRYRNPQIFDPEALRQASLALQKVTLSVADFQEVLTWATAGILSTLIHLTILFLKQPASPVTLISPLARQNRLPWPTLSLSWLNGDATSCLAMLGLNPCCTCIALGAVLNSRPAV